MKTKHTPKRNKPRKSLKRKRCGGNIESYRQNILNNQHEFTKHWENLDSSINENDSVKFSTTGSASTYGYMTVRGFQTIYEKYIEKGGKRNNINFYDLGSGMGNPTIMASILVSNISKAVGIELSTVRHEKAVSVLKKFENYGIHNKTHFYNDNILNSNLSYRDADFIWISSLCFSDEIRNQLSEKLRNELKKGTHVFSSKELNLDGFVEHFDAEMSWTTNSKVNHYIIN